MNDSTKRALRTLAQGLIAVVAVLPAYLALVPASWSSDAKYGGLVTALVAAVTVVCKVVNAAEDAGVIKAHGKTPAAK